MRDQLDSIESVQTWLDSLLMN